MMVGKTFAQLEQEQRDRANAMRSEQSAARVEEGRRKEAMRQAADAEQKADQAREYERLWQLKRTDPDAWNALPDGTRMAVARYMAGQMRTEKPVQYSGYVDPRFPKLHAMQASDPVRFETELQRLSPTDKMAFGRWQKLQPKA